MAWDGEARPPRSSRWLMRVAGWLAPWRERAHWRSQWESGLRDWWILVQRGELTKHAEAELTRHCRAAFRDALRRRCTRWQLREWARGPACVMCAALAPLLPAALLTRGFAVTRGLLAVVWQPPGQRDLLLVPYVVPIVFAFATGVMLVAIGRLWVHGYGWRYWAFFLFKILAAMLVVPLLWIEGGTALRGVLRHPELRVLIGVAGSGVALVAGFGYALLWSFADQRRRCPVCLRRLALPVSLGSWASIFEPATTELLCEEGHGRLCVTDADAGEADRWTELDASWRAFFH